MKDLLGALGIMVLVVGGIAGATVGSYYLYAFLAPKYEATRRDVMIESRAYSEGTVRELYNLQRQYAEAQTERDRDIIAASARHEFQIFPKDRLPPDLRSFMAQVGG